MPAQAPEIEPMAAAVEPRGERHAHPYFTAQPNSVVAAYIERFSRPGEIVLDPFSGSGTTAREALRLGRRALALDLSPLACRITSFTCLGTADPARLRRAFEQLRARCEGSIRSLYEQNEAEVAATPIPHGAPRRVPLPRDSDAGFRFVADVFTRRNTIALSILRHHIRALEDREAREFFLALFSGILHRASRTYAVDPARAGGGDSSVFKQHRYWIPRHAEERNVWELFATRFARLQGPKLSADAWLAPLQRSRLVLQGDAGCLPLRAASVDYIYADPPYGRNIDYLGLAAMWHAWLDLGDTERLLPLQIVEGSDRGHSAEEYRRLLAATLPEMARVLRPGRWLSLAFAHRKIAFWETLVRAASEAGLEYRNTVVQPTRRPSFHKCNTPLRTLSGQLILNFRVPIAEPRECGVRSAECGAGDDGRPMTNDPSTASEKAAPTPAVGCASATPLSALRTPHSLETRVREIALRVAGCSGGATTEQIYHAVIPALLEEGRLEELARQTPDLMPWLEAWLRFDLQSKRWRVE